MQKILCLAALLLCVRLSAQWAPQPRMTVEPIARYGKIADTLFALAEGFLYKSTDDGQHWNFLPDVPLAPPNFAGNDRNLWINPDNQRIYIQDIFTLLESRDYGQSWQVLELPGVQAPVFTMGFRGDTIYLADLTLLPRS